MKKRQSGLSILEELGRLVVGWNTVETALKGLLMGLSKDPWLTYVVATHMSSTAQCDALRVWANERATADHRDHLLHTIQFTEVLRSCRNHYVHTTIGVPGADDSAIGEALGLVHTTVQVTARKKLVFRADNVRAEDLRAAYDQTVVLTNYLTALQHHLRPPSLDGDGMEARLPSSLEKPPLPDRLRLPPELSSTDQRQP